MSDEHTPPRGGAAYTLGTTRDGEPRTMVDLGSLVERMGDKVAEMYQDWPEVKATALVQRRMETKLDLALRPTTVPRSMHVAALAAALAAIVGALALVALVIVVAHSLSPLPPHEWRTAIEASR